MSGRVNGVHRPARRRRRPAALRRRARRRGRPPSRRRSRAPRHLRGDHAQRLGQAPRAVVPGAGHDDREPPGAGRRDRVTGPQNGSGAGGQRVRERGARRAHRQQRDASRVLHTTGLRRVAGADQRTLQRGLRRLGGGGAARARRRSGGA